MMYFFINHFKWQIQVCSLFLNWKKENYLLFQMQQMLESQDKNLLRFLLT